MRRRQVLAVLTLLIGTRIDAQEEMHPVLDPGLEVPTQAARALGIDRYLVTHAHQGDERTVQVEMIGAGSESLGVLTMDWGLAGESLLGVSADEIDLLLLWAPVEGRFEVTDRATGVTTAKRLGAGGWVTHSGPELETRPAVLQMAVRRAAIGQQDYLFNSGQLGSHPRPPNRDTRPGASGLCPIDGSCTAPRCTGGAVRGEAVANTRSWCCVLADDDADVLCWNDWCVGCCRKLDCDAFCVFGDYFCTCGLTGFSCGPPC